MGSLGNKEVFAKNLSMYLERSGKSQREMADIVGVSSSTFNDWTKGRKYPRIDKIEFMANYFGIKKSDLIEEHKENSPSEMQLTEGERRLIELLRKFPEDRTEFAVSMVFSALENMPEKKSDT